MVRLFVAWSLLVVATTSAHSAANSVRMEWEGRFERNLSVYNLFADASAQTPNDGMHPFAIITPLFSDYADKHRFVYLPRGATMSYTPDGPLHLPAGAALVKTFSYPHDARDPDVGRRLIETRLLIHAPDGWHGAAYVWNEAQTDATLKVAGARVPVRWIDARGEARATDYLVPNMNQCKYCHRGFGATAPLGLTARQLNRTRPGDGRNQLAAWHEEDLLNHLPPTRSIPRMPDWTSEAYSPNARALAYLDANCAHCHNPRGLAGSTRLDLRYHQLDPHQRGVYYRPTAAGNASRGRHFAVVPGDPEASFLLHRLHSTAPNVRMPEIGRTVVHDEGVALVAEWIRSLAPAD